MAISPRQGTSRSARLGSFGNPIPEHVHAVKNDIAILEGDGVEEVIEFLEDWHVDVCSTITTTHENSHRNLGAHDMSVQIQTGLTIQNRKSIDNDISSSSRNCGGKRNACTKPSALPKASMINSLIIAGMEHVRAHQRVAHKRLEERSPRTHDTERRHERQRSAGEFGVSPEASSFRHEQGPH